MIFDGIGAWGFPAPGAGQSLVMWLFFTRRLRMWLILTVLVPLGSGILRRIGLALERRNGSTGASRALLKAGDLARRRGRRGH